MKFLKILIGLVVFLPNCCAASVPQEIAIRDIFNRSITAKQRERAVPFIQPRFVISGLPFEETSRNTLKALQDSFNDIPLSNVPAPIFRGGEYNNLLTLKELFGIWLSASTINVRQDVETALRRVESNYSGVLSPSQQANVRHDVPLWVSGMGLEQTVQGVKRNRPTIEANHKEFLLRRGIDEVANQLIAPGNETRLEQ
ncbi:MAG: hypothetical protein LBU35_03730, partial [Holosporales bacterium]|nr:hypothetical protein [Holosporales bacterium]